MALVELFYDRSSGDWALVPFAIDKSLGGGNSASGKMERFSSESFLQHGIERVASSLGEFYSREATEPSELYNVMSKNERERFLRQHEVIRIFQKQNESQIRVYAGDDRSERHELPWPCSNNAFIAFLEGILGARLRLDSDA